MISYESQMIEIGTMDLRYLSYLLYVLNLRTDRATAHIFIVTRLRTRETVIFGRDGRQWELCWTTSLLKSLFFHYTES